MKQHKRVAVILVHWNTASFLFACISSLFAQTYRNFDIILVDNGSPDKGVALVKKRWRNRLIYLHSDKNLGFAGGNNLGLEYALENGYQYAALLNVDATADRRWLGQLVKSLDNDDETAIVTSTILMYYPYQLWETTAASNGVITEITTDVQYRSVVYRGHGPLAHIVKSGKTLLLPHPYKAGERVIVAVPYQGHTATTSVVSSTHERFKLLNKSTNLVQNAGTYFDYRHHTYRDRNNFVPLPYVQSHPDPDAGCGCAMAVRMAVVKQLGVFNAKFVNYYEDSELSVRFGRAGHRIKLVSEAQVLHYHWGSTDVQKKKYNERLQGMRLREYYGIRNRLLIIKRYHPWWSYLYALARTLARWVLLTPSAFRNRWIHFQWRAYFRAMIDSIIL